MSANVYNIESLLIGKTYFSRSVTGEIIDAEKSDKVWYADCDTYLVKVRPSYTASRIRQDDTYRFLAVKTGE
jgi:hypothetical protein